MNQAVGRRTRQKITTQDRLIAATTTLLAEFPLEAVKIEDICEKADISRKTFYNYFPSRQDIIYEVIVRLLLDESDRNYQKALEKHRSTEDRLFYFLAAQGKNLSDQHQLQQNLIRHAMLDLSIDSARSQTMMENNILIVEALFEEGQKNGDVNPKYSPRFLAEMVTGLINTSAIHWIHFPDYPVNQRYGEVLELIRDIVVV